MKALLLFAASSVLILVTEYMKRRYALPVGVTRKLVHIGTAMVAVAAPYFASMWEIVVVALAFACIMMAGRFGNFFLSIHAVNRVTFGEVFLPLGVALTAYFYLPQSMEAYQYGVLIMGVSDALASLIGEQYGKHMVPFLPGRKTFEGVGAFYLSALVLTFIFVPIQSSWILIIPAILTVVEVLSIYGLDNIILPILGAYLISLLR